MRKRPEIMIIALVGLLAGLWVYVGWPERPKGSFRLVTEDGRPILTEEDLVRYDWQTHTLQMKPEVVERVFRDKLREFRAKTFLVEANGVVCYRGTFMSLTSSSSAATVVIMVPWLVWPQGELSVQIPLQLGSPTPGYFQGANPRGDPRIRTALEQAGKLRE